MFLDDIVTIASRAIFRYPEPISYLTRRGVTEEEIRLYGLGYWKVIGVPDDGTKDRERFMEETWKGRKFEGKVIFPIFDVLGRVMGIVGRAVDSKDYKTFVLQEAKTNGYFFGVREALKHIYEKNRAYVVEGCFDFFALRRVLPNTVASMTAGLYKNQYEYLGMFCDTMVTVFDSDPPGREAAEKAEREHKNVRTMDLGFSDPDKCMETLGPSRFKKHVLDKMNKLFFLGG